MCVSLARAIGPAVSTSLFSLSVDRNILGGYAVYAILFCLSCFVVLWATFLPEKVWEKDD
ncbi:hypothetical protein BD779DRAFT_1562010 [Infundibulicybe gibba]|nr:hypothetical protein BD779DRAFT_1562010 [Infundibulicybe gibba]